MALRELALRRVADRVDAAAREALGPVPGSRPWLARDRILVAIGPDPQAEQLVRAGKRLADALDANWSVVYVETPALLRLSESERNRRIDLLRLAESLGAETVTLDGPTAAETIERVREDAPGEPRARGRPEAARLARLAAALDHDDARAPRARLRRHHDRGGRRRRRPRAGRARGRRRAGGRIPLGAARLGPAHDRDLHGARLRHVSFLRAHEHRDGLRARRDDRGAAVRARPRGHERGRERGGLRLLLRAAALHVRGLRRAVRGHLRGHAGGHARDREPDGERAPADARRRRARAAHGAPVRHEPGARRDARDREHGRGRGAPRGRSVRLRGCPAPARRRGTPAGAAARAGGELLAGARGPFDRAVGGGSRPPGRHRLRHVAVGARTLRAARRGETAPRRAGGPAAQPPARAAAGAAAPARDLRGPGRPCARARAADGNHGRGARLRRERAPAQHDARIHLARPAHAARGDGRGGQHARPARAGARRSPRASRSRRRSRTRRAR